MDTISLPPYLISIGQNNTPDVLVAHIQDGRILFMHEILKESMRNYGINIPPTERTNYEGKSVVYLTNGEDQLFEKAFRNIYFPLHMSKEEYRWQYNTPRA